MKKRFSWHELQPENFANSKLAKNLNSFHNFHYLDTVPIMRQGYGDCQTVGMLFFFK